MTLVRPRYPATQRDYDRIALAIKQVTEGRLTGALALDAVPTGGTWAQGDIVRNSNPTEVTSSAGANYVIFGWICTVAGSPGTWEEMRVLTSTVTVGWDDLRFPAQAINPAGATAAPTVITTETGFPGCLEFAGNADQMIAGVAQMPHAWKRESTIRPHIHWSKPTGSSSAVTWELYVRVIGNPGDVAGAWSSAYTGSLVAGDQTVSDGHLLSTFGNVTMTDLEESAILAWRIYRRGSTDADNNAVRFYEFDIHYQIDKPGTDAEIPA